MFVACIRSAVRCERLRAARVALDGDDLALAAHERREVRRLAAGRGAEVEHALAGLRVERAGDEHRGARLRRVRALRATAGGRGRRTGRRRRGPRAARRRRAWRPGSAAASSSRVVTSVLALSAVSAGSLPRRSSARASSAPYVCHHSWTSHSRVGVRDRRAGRAVVGRQPRQLARRPPQDGVDELVPAAVALLCELDALPHDGVRAAAVEERELVEPEPQRGCRRGVELVDRPGELLDHVVEAELALHGAEGELHRERPLARLEILRLSVERAVGVGALLEHPAHDCEGRPPRGRDPGVWRLDPYIRGRTRHAPGAGHTPWPRR